MNCLKFAEKLQMLRDINVSKMKVLGTAESKKGAKSYIFFRDSENPYLNETCSDCLPI